MHALVHLYLTKHMLKSYSAKWDLSMGLDYMLKCFAESASED